MLKTIASIASLTAFTLVPTAANASVTTGGHIQGFPVVAIYESPTVRTWDTILIEGPYGTETIEVRCQPFDWKSTGPNNKSFVDMIARSWCF